MLAFSDALVDALTIKVAERKATANNTAKVMAINRRGWILSWLRDTCSMS